MVRIVGDSGGGAGPIELGFIADELRRAWDGEPWHGPSLVDVLAGITPEQAGARPMAGAHTIGELVLHLAAWTREVARRLRDRVAREPVDGDWPPFTGAPGEWERTRETLARAHEELMDALAAFPGDMLAAPVGTSVDRPLGTGLSYAAMLHGIAQHHAYHAGQIALLRKG